MDAAPGVGGPPWAAETPEPHARHPGSVLSRQGRRPLLQEPPCPQLHGRWPLKSPSPRGWKGGWGQRKRPPARPWWRDPDPPGAARRWVSLLRDALSAPMWAPRPSSPPPPSGPSSLWTHTCVIHPLLLFASSLSFLESSPSAFPSVLLGAPPRAPLLLLVPAVCLDPK